LLPSPGSPRCCYPITGGLLAPRAAGQIVSCEERAGDWLHLRSTIAASSRRWPRGRGEANWTGALHSHVQRRVHLAISQRYFNRPGFTGGFGLTTTVSSATSTPPT
jgi:hypothetical protein